MSFLSVCPSVRVFPRVLFAAIQLLVRFTFVMFRPVSFAKPSAKPARNPTTTACNLLSRRAYSLFTVRYFHVTRANSLRHPRAINPEAWNPGIRNRDPGPESGNPDSRAGYSGTTGTSTSTVSSRDFIHRTRVTAVAHPPPSAYGIGLSGIRVRRASRPGEGGVMHEYGTVQYCTVLSLAANAHNSQQQAAPSATIVPPCQPARLHARKVKIFTPAEGIRLLGYRYRYWI